jgi:hypothetical protein
MECVAACSAQDALQLALPPLENAPRRARWARRRLGPIAVACVLMYFLLAVVLFARATNHWKAEMPRSVYLRLVPYADQVTHPGM